MSYNINGQNEIAKYFTISKNGDLTTKDLLPIHFSAKLLELGVVAEDLGGRSGRLSLHYEIIIYLDNSCETLCVLAKRGVNTEFKIA